MALNYSYFGSIPTCLVKENTRPNDDYVNATVWSKAFGKEWRKYKQSQRCNKTIKALTASLDSPISAVIETKRGKDYKVRNLHLVELGHGKVHETWVHSEIAIDFAEWLSPEFSSFVKRIFIRYLKGDRTQDKMSSGSESYALGLDKPFSIFQPLGKNCAN